MEKITIRTTKRNEFQEITRKIAQLVQKSGVEEGVCTIYVPHTTAGVLINENADSSVARDIEEKLKELVPYGAGYHHLEGNADAHIKSAIVGVSVSIPISDGQLALGTWQGIFFCEFDGPRTRSVIVQIAG